MSCVEDFRQLPDGKWEITLEWDWGAKTCIRWDHYPLHSELVAARKEPPHPESLELGGETWAERRVFGPVALTWIKNVGPPPWPWPKVAGGYRKGSLYLRVGWKMTAYDVSMSRTKKKQ